MSTRSEAMAAAPIAWPQVALGGLLIALGDAAFATTYWFSWNVAGVTRMFQVGTSRRSSWMSCRKCRCRSCSICRSRQQARRSDLRR